MLTRDEEGGKDVKKRRKKKRGISEERKHFPSLSLSGPQLTLVQT